MMGEGLPKESNYGISYHLCCSCFLHGCGQAEQSGHHEHAVKVDGVLCFPCSQTSECSKHQVCYDGYDMHGYGQIVAACQAYHGDAKYSVDYLLCPGIAALLFLYLGDLSSIDLMLGKKLVAYKYRSR